jgi:endonuclease-3
MKLLLRPPVALLLFRQPVPLPRRSTTPRIILCSSSVSSSSPAAPPSSSLHLLPPDFPATWGLIKELRADRTAVVDRVGAAALHAHPGAAEDAGEAAYQALVCLMLSSQTKDVVNAEAMERLRAHGLSVDNILDRTDAPTLNGLIRKVGFHNTKTKHILATTRLLRENHGGAPPSTMPELLALPGVGPKMAIIFMHVVHQQVVGISVDTHVHRIANLLGWTSFSPPGEEEQEEKEGGEEEEKRTKTKTKKKGAAKAAGGKTARPEQTRRELERRMPFELWGEVNELIVGLGQETQTEMPKLLAKCTACSDPTAAFVLLERLLGVDALQRALIKAGVDDPRG